MRLSLSHFPVVLCGLIAFTGGIMAGAADSKPAAAQAMMSRGDLNPILEPLRRKHKMPALTAMVIKGDAIVAGGAVGVRKQGDPTPVTFTDKWHIGSNTKAMTATIAAMLVEQGKISWDRRLEEIFPDLAPSMNEQYRRVTLEQLLCHRAGFPANTPASGESSSLQEQRLSTLRATVSKPPNSRPGTKFLYSNTGYVVAGAVLEKVTGKSWEELIREMLFTPLGMASAGFGPPSTPGKTDQPWGHVMQAGSIVALRADNPLVLGPAGTVHCNLEDYAKFVLLHNRQNPEPKSLLNAASIARLHIPPFSGEYASGWIVASRPWAGGAALTHAGSNTMNYFVAWLAPRKQLAVVVATNLGDSSMGGACDEIVGALLEKYLPK